MEKSIYSLYENVLIEWLPGDWKEAFVKDVWENRYLVQLKDVDMVMTVESSQIKRKNENTSKFF